MELTWVYLFKNDTSLRVYQISFLLLHRTTMTATYSSDPAKLTESLEFGAQIYSDASSITKKPDAKAGGGTKNWETLKKIAAWQLTKVRNETEVIDEAWNKGRRGSFCVIHGSLSSQECGVRASISKVQRLKLYSEVTLWKMIQDHTQYLLNKDHQHHKWQSQISWTLFWRLPGCAGQAADAVSAFSQVEMEDARNVIENSKVRMSRYLDPSTETQMAQIMVQYGRPSCSSWKKSVRVIFWQDYDGNGNLRFFF